MTAVLNNTTLVESIVTTGTAADVSITVGADAVIAASGTLTTSAASLTAGGAIELTYNGAAITTASKIQNVTGSAGDDIIAGGAGNDIIVGGDGNDSITGSTGIDNLSGGAGNDTFAVATLGAGFTGLTTAETISGGTGTDTLQFADGAVTIAASDLVSVSGIDIIELQNVATNASLTLTDAWFTANGTTALAITATTQQGGATTVAASTLSAANSIQLTMSNTANSAGNVINLGAGNDTLTIDLQALNNTTTLAGGSGTDTLVIAANTGSATITQDATVTGWETVSFATAGIAGTFATIVNDAGVAAAATQTINGSNLTGTLLWNGAAELDGKFSISGGSGADSLTGGSLVDTITAGLGADVITGGLGADSLTGGLGVDTFVYATVAQSNGSNTDTITDFVTGTDKLQVTLDYSALTSALDINTTRASAGVAGTTLAQDALSGQRGQFIYDTTASALYVNFNNDNLLTTSDYKINLNAAATATASIVEGDINFVITGGTNADVITAGSGADTISGGAGADLINGGVGVDQITSGADTDTITVNVGGSGAVTTTTVANPAVVNVAGLDIYTVTQTDIITILSAAGAALTFTAYVEDSARDTEAAVNAAGGAVTLGSDGFVMTYTGTYAAATGLFTTGAQAAVTDMLVVYDTDGTGAGTTFQAVVLVGVDNVSITTAGVITSLAAV